MKVLLLSAVLMAAPAQDPVERGNEAYREGRYAEAAALYEKALEKTESPAVRMNLGHARYRLGEWDAAVEAYRRSGSDESLRWIAQCHFGADRLEEAEHAALAHLVRFPDTPPVRALLVEIWSRTGRHEKAAAACRAMVRAQPGDARLYRTLAGELLAAGRDEEAIDALEADASHAEALLYLGRIAEGEEKPEEALKEYRAAIERDPDFAAAHAALGDLLLRRGEHAGAAAAFAEAIRCGEGSAAVHYNRVVALHRAGRAADAAAALKEALRAHPAARELAALLDILAADAPAE